MSAPDELWVCPLKGCELDAQNHSLATALEHIFADELSPEEAKAVADRTLDRLEQAVPDIVEVAAKLQELL